jgi:crossover junction endodeoxyribonuclease RuvC
MTADGPNQAGLVLGIDPGSRRMGWALVDVQGSVIERVDGGVLRLAGRLSVPERLGAIHGHVLALLDARPVDSLAIESAFVYENARTALVLGQARGVPIGLAAVRGIDVHEYQPSVVKKQVVGSGRASKHQVRHMVQLLLELDEPPPEDEADALAVAITHVRMRAMEVSSAVRGVHPGLVAPAPPLKPAQAHYASLLRHSGGGGRRRGPIRRSKR